MPTHSALAAILRTYTAVLVFLAFIWLEAFGPTRPGIAVLGAVLILFCYSPVLAVEFAMLRAHGPHAPAPRPNASQLVRAWFSETIMAVRVFYWRQPFRWRAEPDFLGPGVRGQRGAVFVHGFMCNRGIWAPWLARMRAQGRAFTAVNLEPVFGSIDEYPHIIDAAIRRIEDATGLPPLVVCHSMGGLAVRAWLRQPGAAAHVHRVVTIGTPHRGTWLTRYFSHSTNTREMRPEGNWLRQLERDEAARPLPPFTCWYSNCDNVVFPAATATLPGADNRHVEGAAHVALAFRPEVIEASLALLGS